MAKSFSSLPLNNNTWYRKLLDLQYQSIYLALKKYLDSLPLNSLRILDFGHGNCPYEKLFVKAQLYHTLDANYPSTYQLISEIPSGQLYDLIIIAEVLEHLPDPQQTLQQLGELLSPMGKIWISVPFNARIHHAPSDYWRFTPEGLCALVGENFNITSLEPRGSDLASISCKINYYLYLRPWLLPLYLLTGLPLLVLSHFQLWWNLHRSKSFSQTCYHDPLGIVAILQLK